VLQNEMYGAVIQLNCHDSYIFRFFVIICERVMAVVLVGICS